MKPTLAIFSLMLYCFQTIAQISIKPLIISDEKEIFINQSLYQLKDATATIDIARAIELFQKNKFSSSFSANSRQEFGYNTAIRWLNFSLKATQKADLMLELEYANMDKLELYELKSGKIRSLGFAGDVIPFYQRPYINNNYVFPIRLEAGEQAHYFLMIDQRNAILSSSIRLWQRTAFLAIDRDEYLLWGIFIGIICLVMVVNLIMLLTTRDWIYFWYTLYVHFMTMHIFSDAGLGFQYLWQNAPQINHYLPVYLYVWAGMIAQTTFMQHFVHQNSTNSRIYRWVQAFKGLVLMALLLIIGIIYFDLEGEQPFVYKTVSLATSYFVPVIAILTLLSLYERRHERVKLVRYYGYALFMQFLGYMVVAIINFSQAEGMAIPFSLDVLTYVIIGFTLLLDIVFFNYGLAYRYNYSEQNNKGLQLKLLQTKQQNQQQVIDALEEERKRLSQDLHDDVGATLSTAKGYLSMLKRQEKTDVYNQAQQLLDEAAEELRNLSHQLMPKNFDRIGLTKAIEESVNKASGREIAFEFVSMGKVQGLDNQAEMLIFSMATEVIRKIEKQNDTTEATVQLIYHPEVLNFSVEFNGKPIPDSDWENLHIKANFLKAEWQIDGNAQGNSLMLEIPMKQPILNK